MALPKPSDFYIYYSYALKLPPDMLRTNWSWPLVSLLLLRAEFHRTVKIKTGARTLGFKSD
jgi:hypothetical protein